MTKRILTGALVAGLALSLAACKEEEKAAETTTETTSVIEQASEAASDAVETATEAAEAASEAASDAIEAATDAVTAAGEGAVEAASDAAEAAVDAATDAADAATEATEAATDTASDAAAVGADTAEAATDVAADAAADAMEAASDAADAATDAVVEGDSSFDLATAAEVLTVDGFDLEKATDLVNASTLSDEAKATVITSMEQAADNPAILGAILYNTKTLVCFYLSWRTRAQWRRGGANLGRPFYVPPFKLSAFRVFRWWKYSKENPAEAGSLIVGDGRAGQSTNAFSTTYSLGSELAPSRRPKPSRMAMMSLLNARLPQTMPRSVSGFIGAMPRSSNTLPEDRLSVTRPIWWNSSRVVVG
jgi:hypothetical protein